MQTSQAGIDLIKSFEGYHTKLPDGRCKAYLDTLAKPHVWTIGYGCTDDVHPGLIWTEQEAEDALRRELRLHEIEVNRLVTVEIGQNNFDALVSFNYNTGGLGKSTLLKKLNRGDFDGAAREFDRWNKAGGRVYRGLVRRRAAERAMFEQDAKDSDIPDGEPDMPQAVEPAPAPPKPVPVAITSALSTATIASAVGSTKEGLDLLEKAKGIIGPDISPLIWPMVVLIIGVLASILIVRARDA